jgi:hypothetical protein
MRLLAVSGLTEAMLRAAPQLLVPQAAGFLLTGHIGFRPGLIGIGAGGVNSSDVIERLQSLCCSPASPRDAATRGRFGVIRAVQVARFDIWRRAIAAVIRSAMWVAATTCSRMALVFTNPIVGCGPRCSVA